MFRPQQCSEREPGGYEDCAWCSGVMLQNAAHGRNVRPSTRSEYEALRVAGGDGPAEKPGDGSNMVQVKAGIINRYGWSPTRIDVGISWAIVRMRLTPGVGMVLTGSMGAVPSYWRRWDVGFRGAHSVYVQREDGNERVWWQNPLAPNAYAGEWMPMSVLRDYYNGLRGGALYARVGSLAPPDTGTEEPLEAFSIPQNPSIATSEKPTKLWTSSKLTGTAVDIPAGHTKRYIGHPRGDDSIAIIGNDGNPDIDGKSALYGRAADWHIRETP